MASVSQFLEKVYEEGNASVVGSGNKVLRAKKYNMKMLMNQ
jgi:hypothetical protein